MYLSQMEGTILSILFQFMIQQENKFCYDTIQLQNNKLFYLRCQSYSKQYDKDIINGVYQGGYKLWECTLDFLKYIQNQNFANKHVLEIGCGHGLLGIQCLLNGAVSVTFQDFNKQVIQNLTINNICQNIKEGGNMNYIYGDWDNLMAYKINIQVQKFDIILGSQLIYEQCNYDKILRLISKLLKDDGICILANKFFYFGVGGNMNNFKQRIDEFGFKWQSLKKIVPKSGNKKQIIKITKQ